MTIRYGISIVNGYVTVKTNLPTSFHEYVYQQLNSVVENEGNPGNNVLPRIPEIQEVFDQPVIRGRLYQYTRSGLYHAPAPPVPITIRPAVRRRVGIKTAIGVI